ncbi:MAG: hypothetical protein R3E39_29840 [Anaerolineae bacterium]
MMTAYDTIVQIIFVTFHQLYYYESTRRPLWRSHQPPAVPAWAG